MFTFFDLINHYLGFFNFNPKLKNRIYTIMGFTSNWYLLYLALNFFKNQIYGRGFLFLAVFLVLLYFSVYNLVYYFSNTTLKGDISPKIEMLLGGKPKEETMAFTDLSSQGGAVYNQAGIYDSSTILTSKLTIHSAGQKNLDTLAGALIQSSYFHSPYHQLATEQLIDLLKQNNTTAAYTIGEATQLPAYSLVEEKNELWIYAGLNALEQKPIGTIQSAGTLSMNELKKNYQLFPVACFLRGGAYQALGRSGLLAGNEPYSVEVHLAYQKNIHE